MGIIKTRARRKWENVFPIVCLFRACVECMRLRREFFVSRGCVLSYTILFLVQVRWTRVVPIKLASWIESPLGPRSIHLASPPLATILGRVRFLWWYSGSRKEWNVFRATHFESLSIASFGIKSIRDLRRDIIFRFTMTNSLKKRNRLLLYHF